MGEPNRCASFQAAVVDTIIDRSRAGLRLFGESVGQANAMVVAGGVAAKGAIRRALTRFCGESGLRLVLPPPQLCTELAQQEEVNAGILGNWSSALLREMRRQLLGRSPKITAGGSIAFASKLDQLVEFDCRQRQISLLDGAFDQISGLDAATLVPESFSRVATLPTCFGLRHPPSYL